MAVSLDFISKGISKQLIVMCPLWSKEGVIGNVFRVINRTTKIISWII